MTASSELAGRFAALFRGNPRSYGQWMPKNGKVMTEHKTATEKEYMTHLSGGVGLGLVPVMDDGFCWFGAIDIDNHGSDKDIDLLTLTRKATAKKMPLVLCRSKSGGVHAYVFGREPLRAKLLRSALSKWAIQLGYPDAERFPKQDYLDKDADGHHSLGHWINLCYWNGDDGNRYAIRDDGKKLPLEPFIELAESRGITMDEINTLATNDGHLEAPPCIQHMLGEGVPEGYRNQALYNITVYLKRARPNTFADDALDINNTIFDPPMPSMEARRTIRSASRRSYKYKCQEEPCKSLCNSSVCVKREFGIDASEYDDINAQISMPEIGDIVEYITDPVKWGITVNGTLIDNLSTEDILNYAGFRHRVAEQQRILIPLITKRKWESIIGPKMMDARMIEMPKDASTFGVIAARLQEFAAKAQMDSVLGDTKEREKLLRGVPVVQTLDDEDGRKYVMFRAMDFVKHLKSTKSELVVGPNLWFALKRELGVRHKKMRVKNKIMTVWYVPLDEDARPEIDVPDYKTEF